MDKKLLIFDLDGTLSDAMRGADVFIGVSAPGIVTEEMVKSMRRYLPPKGTLAIVRWRVSSGRHSS